MADIITVTALNRYVKTLLDSDYILTDIAVRGEITNFVHHKSGHMYFSLRDNQSSVRAVMFRRWAQELPFRPQDGMRVVLRCRVSLYEQTGSFQLYVEDIFPDGLGAVQLAFEQLKEKLAQEGLFDPSRKQPVPERPRCIGLVTSKTGAALQDILNVSQRRWPLTHFLLCPVNVQGDDAARQIVAAVQTLDKKREVDVILIARGGGSREDLWVFNDEKIARAVCACSTPVVSAVGHEIDFTILDLAADLRAPTPSAAAELLCPDQREMQGEICRIFENIHKNMQERLTLCYNETEQLSAAAAGAGQQFLARNSTQLKEQTAALQAAFARQMENRQQQLAAKAALARALDPMGVLARGYLMARDEKGSPTTLAGICPGQNITVEDTALQAHCLVTQVTAKETE